MPITGITSRVSRLAASLGLTKTDARPVRNATREISAAEYNVLADGLVAVQEEVGKHDGSEPGSLVARTFALESGTIPANAIQTFASTPGSVASTTALARVTYAGGTTALDVSAIPVGGRVEIVKGNTSTYGITVVGDGNDAINGGSAGAAMTLPGSTTPCSTTASDPKWTVYRDSSTAIRVVGSPGSQSITSTRDPRSSDTYPSGTDWYNSISYRTWKCVASGVWICTGSNPLLAAWNGTDLSQFVESGDSNWTTSIDTSGPNGAPRIVWTTTQASGTKDRYLIMDAGVLPDQYTVEADIGPYSGNNNALQRVMVKLLANYVDSTHFVGVSPQGDNSGSANARNMQSAIANGGAASYAGLITNGLPGGAFPLGRVRVRISKTSSAVAMSTQTFGGASVQTQAAYATSSADKIGIYVVHYGQSQAIGDSGYLYGLRVYAGWF